MAPAACDTILQNLMDFGRGEKDYDRIITGDLGYVGQSILFDLLRKKGLDIKENHMDCGMTIFDQQTQHTNSGGSGCGCACGIAVSCGEDSFHSTTNAVGMGREPYSDAQTFLTSPS